MASDLLDLKATALEHILSITGTIEGRELLLKLPDLLVQLIALTQDFSTAISKDATLALINITADELGTNAFLLISETQPKNEKYNYNLIHIYNGQRKYFSRSLLYDSFQYDQTIAFSG